MLDLTARFDELRLLCKQYKPQVVAVQECQLRTDTVLICFFCCCFFSCFFWCNKKSSPGDNATGGVTLYISESFLFSEIKLDIDLQAVAVRVSAKKTLTVCNVYLPPSLDVHFSDLEHLVEQLHFLFVLIGDFNAHSLFGVT